MLLIFLFYTESTVAYLYFVDYVPEKTTDTCVPDPFSQSLLSIYFFVQNLQHQSDMVNSCYIAIFAIFIPFLFHVYPTNLHLNLVLLETCCLYRKRVKNLANSQVLKFFFYGWIYHVFSSKYIFRCQLTFRNTTTKSYSIFYLPL